MLKKLLKYDLRAVSKLWWIGAVISGGAAVVGAVLMRFFFYTFDDEVEGVLVPLMAILGFVVAIFCILAVFIAFVFTVVLVFVRFYKHFFTDEGYLTFTLPVKRSALFFSKTLNAAIWLFAHFAVIVISLFLFALLVYSPEGSFLNLVMLEQIGDLFANAWASVGAWLIVYIFEALLIIVVYLMFLISLIHFCITVGAVFVKKAKVILAIGIYYAFSSVLAVIVQFGTLFLGGLMSEGMMALMENATQNQGCAIYAFLVLAITAAFGAIAAVLYSVTQYMLDRKLNLA